MVLARPGVDGGEQTELGQSGGALRRRRRRRALRPTLALLEAIERKRSGMVQRDEDGEGLL